jgi:hypothetical protein
MIGSIVTCTIKVIAGMFLTTAQLQGTVLKVNDTNYLVDFSKAAAEKNLRPAEGDSESLLVKKESCI